MDPDNSSDCAICLGSFYDLDNLGGSNSADTGPVVTSTPCLHHFHSHCLFQWIEYRSSQSLPGNCPVCKVVFSARQPFSVQLPPRKIRANPEGHLKSPFFVHRRENKEDNEGTIDLNFSGLNVSQDQPKSPKTEHDAGEVKGQPTAPALPVFLPPVKNQPAFCVGRSGPAPPPFGGPPVFVSPLANYYPLTSNGVPHAVVLGGYNSHPSFASSPSTQLSQTVSYSWNHPYNMIRYAKNTFWDPSQ